MERKIKPKQIFVTQISEKKVREKHLLNCIIRVDSPQEQADLKKSRRAEVPIPKLSKREEKKKKASGKEVWSSTRSQAPTETKTTEMEAC